MNYLRNQPNSMQITLKAFLTGALILVMMIPALLVSNLVTERQERQKEVVREISGNWAKEQTLAAPYLVIPYNWKNEKATRSELRYYLLMPEEIHIDGSIQPYQKKRSIFTVNLYQADMEAAGFFNLDRVKTLSNEQILWDQVMVCYGISDMKGLEGLPKVAINNQQLVMEQGLPALNVLTRGSAASVSLASVNDRKQIPFKFTIAFKGTQAISFLPVGRTSTVKIESPWKQPSFFGGPLPEHTQANGFTAEWKTNSINNGIPQVWDNATYKVQDMAFGVQLFDSNNHYAKVDRSIKYAILLIGLTFGFFFIFELLIGKRVHPVQYVLVGVALIVFYTLLLSLSEYTGFGKAYLIAGIATVLLITLYCRNMFRSWSNALIVTFLLILLYSFVYFIIQLEDLNLLVGSVGLFILVAVAMFITRKIDWYGGKPGNEGNRDITPGA